MEIELSDANFKQEVLETKQPCLVDFWAEWCMSCQMIAPTIEAIAREYKGRLKVCKINIDEAPKISSEYGIMSIPTLVIFKNGKVVAQVTGVLSKIELESKIKPHLEQN